MALGRHAEGGNMTKRATVANAIIAFMLALAVLLLAGGGVAFAAGEEGQGNTGEAASANADATAVSDSSTIWDWEDLIKGTTQNIGRVWTDKTVQTGDMTKDDITVKKAEGSDFLTALTALSSTSNLSSTSTTPLDIVLVLDASGSMSDAMGRGDSTKRITALQKAANSFIDTIAVQNAGLDESKQHHVSLIKFAGDKIPKIGNDTDEHGYNYSQVMKSMAACTSDTKADFKKLINAIKPSGATNAQAGMELAEDQTSDRSDAKKVVVFFTDGTPTTYQDFNESVASGAVTSAYGMKHDGATVYSIGIFSGANPTVDPVGSTVSNENKFMHAVSSNYPSASYTEGSGKYSWYFGDRAKDDEGNNTTFYKSATNATELAKIFEDISKEITEGAGYPTETTEGKASTTGYITFDDQLGDYMQVDEMTALVYNGSVYKDPEKSTSGNTDTYTFKGTVNSDTGDKDLKDILISVEHSVDSETGEAVVEDGDKVTVQIPASLIPLRHFKIDLTNDTMKVDETTPISVFYSSSLKSEAKELLADPDNYMKSYIEKNTDADGKVAFYADEWSSNKEDKALGTTKAWFNPSKKNKYYYFTQDTPIYTDEACTQRATSVEADRTYYYQHEFYVNQGDKPVAISDTHSFPGKVALDFTNAIGTDSDGYAIINAGTPRLLYLNELHKEKVENTTGTATDVLNPKWEGGTSVADTTTVRSFLGNNGKLTLDNPATLQVSKTVTVSDGYELSDYSDTDFTFNISVPNAAGKSFEAKVLNAEGEQVGDTFSLTFDDGGAASHTLKHGQTLQVFGLSAGWSYTVSEGTLPSGFTQTSPVDEGGNPAAASGTLAAGGTATASFTNNYSAESVSYDAVAAVGAYKTLTGRDWTDSDSFTFKLEGLNGAPMPQQDSVTVSKANVFDGKAAISFGDATYTKPGTYQYQVTEENAGKTIDGVTYSSNVAKFTVNVTDVDAQGAHTGKLVATATLDSGSSAVFSNVYQAAKVTYDTAAAGLTKVLNGRDWTQDDEFTFKITAKDGAPLPKDASGADVDQITVNKSTAQNFSFGTMTFTYDMLDGATSKIFNYTVDEVKGSADGVSYDGHTATIEVTVTDNGAGNLTAAAKVSAPTFTNTYSASTKEPVKITGTKALTGRDMTAGEFSFGVRLAGTSTDVLTATNKADGSIDFGELSYSTEELAKLVEQGKATKEGKVWSIKYQAYENTEGLADKGITPQASSFEFTVTVRDNLDGTLTAAAQMPDGGLAFKNTYSTNSATVSLSGAKVLEYAAGLTPDSIEGKFTFTLSSDDANAPMPEGSQGKTATATNDASGNVSFGDIKFTVDDLNKALGTTDADTQSADQGDSKAADNQSGTKSDESTDAKDASADSKAATKSVSDKGSAGSSADNADSTEDGASASKASESDDSALKLGVAKAYADEGAVKADKARSYTFVYKVIESGSVPGVTNDKDATKTVSIKVTDDGQGHLTAEIVGESGKPAFTFTNKYSADPVELSVTNSIDVTKKLTGRDLSKGEFKFELLDADGKAAATGTNTADGKVSLSAIKYTKPGEYAYTLCEVNGGQTIDHVAYDSATYSVVVKVVDNGKGALEASCQIGDQEGLAFTNTYIEPEPEPEPTPDPGTDDTDDGDDGDNDGDDNGDTGDKSSSSSEDESTSTSAKTGDDMLNLAVAVVVVAAASGSIALAARRRQR